MTTNLAPRLVLYVRSGCHLCTDALAVAERVCAQFGVSWASVDIDANPELRSRYTDHVPVTVLDDRQFSLWFLDEERLRAALAAEVANP